MKKEAIKSEKHSNKYYAVSLILNFLNFFFPLKLEKHEFVTITKIYLEEKNPEEENGHLKMALDFDRINHLKHS